MSINTLQHSVIFAKPFVFYAPLTAGFGLNPTSTVCSIIRNSLLSAPMTWYWNRNEFTFNTVVGQQDYDEVITDTDFSFIEKLTVTDDQGNIFEIKDVYNNLPLSKSAVTQRPSGVAAERVYTSSGAQHVVFRFQGVPDQIYSVTVIYQKLAPQFGPFFITSATAAGPNTSYTGTFDPYSLPTGDSATITGFTNAGNNGTFTIVSCNATTLVLANSGGVNETASAFAVNPAWDPIPDQYSDIYNNLYLSEMLSLDDQQQRAQIYRQRGIAAFLAKATGLTEMQRNAWVQQWEARALSRSALGQLIQQGGQGRGV